MSPLSAVGPPQWVGPTRRRRRTRPTRSAPDHTPVPLPAHPGPDPGERRSTWHSPTFYSSPCRARRHRRRPARRPGRHVAEDGAGRPQAGLTRSRPRYCGGGADGRGRRGVPAGRPGQRDPARCRTSRSRATGRGRRSPVSCSASSSRPRRARARPWTSSAASCAGPGRRPRERPRRRGPHWRRSARARSRSSPRCRRTTATSGWAAGSGSPWPRSSPVAATCTSASTPTTRASARSTGSAPGWRRCSRSPRTPRSGRGTTPATRATAARCGRGGRRRGRTRRSGRRTSTTARSRRWSTATPCSTAGWSTSTPACRRSNPTLEVRVADVCLDVDDAVLLAALARALVETAVQEWRAADAAPTPRDWSCCGWPPGARPARPSTGCCSTRLVAPGPRGGRARPARHARHASTGGRRRPRLRAGAARRRAGPRHGRAGPARGGRPAGGRRPGRPPHRPLSPRVATQRPARHRSRHTAGCAARGVSLARASRLAETGPPAEEHVDQLTAPVIGRVSSPPR